MTTNKELAHLLSLIREFETLDVSLTDQIVKGNFEVINQTVEAKKRIKRFLAECDPVQIGPGLAL